MVIAEQLKPHTLAMRAASLPIPSKPFAISPKTRPQPERRFAFALSAKPQRHRSAALKVASSTSAEDLGGLGRAVLAALAPESPNASNPRSKQQKGRGGDGRQLSGSDVLWALRRASAEKKRTSGKKKPIGSASVETSDKGGEEDYDNVRPLCINPNWAFRLDDLESSLQEIISDTCS